jgi:hypothetical protein
MSWASTSVCRLVPLANDGSTAGSGSNLISLYDKHFIGKLGCCRCTAGVLCPAPSYNGLGSLYFSFDFSPEVSCVSIGHRLHNGLKLARVSQLN